jgi:RNA polymerase sigma-70 factor, ECF subfamily
VAHNDGLEGGSVNLVNIRRGFADWRPAMHVRACPERGGRDPSNFWPAGLYLDQPPPADDSQDRALIRRCLDGEWDAAGGLVDRYQHRLFNVAYRMLGNVQDAEDVTQTVFCNAFLALASYDPKYRFFSWIYRMTVNESLNLLKRSKPMVTLDEHHDVAWQGASPDHAVEADDRVGRALMGLKPDDRAVVVLRHFMSLTYDEIADVLEVPARIVKSRLFTARERLRLALITQSA